MLANYYLHLLFPPDEPRETIGTDLTNWWDGEYYSPSQLERDFDAIKLILQYSLLDRRRSPLDGIDRDSIDIQTPV